MSSLKNPGSSSLGSSSRLLGFRAWVSRIWGCWGGEERRFPDQRGAVSSDGISSPGLPITDRNRRGGGGLATKWYSLSRVSRPNVNLRIRTSGVRIWGRCLGLTKTVLRCSLSDAASCLMHSCALAVSPTKIQFWSGGLRCNVRQAKCRLHTPSKAGAIFVLLCHS